LLAIARARPARTASRTSANEIIIAVVDIGRLFYTTASLNESTRRGARAAAVCPINDPAIAQIAVFNTSGNSGASATVNGLVPANIDVRYLNDAGAAVADPAGAGFTNIRYVRVSINGGFVLQTLIPGLSAVIPTPNFTATLPRESLGVPRQGAVVPC
jgi:Flp pilus assembly protein TadG